MKTITFLGEKGGVSKTSMSVTLATLLSQTGARVLLVDTDPQGHAAIMTRVKREDRLYHLLHNNAPMKEAIVPAPPAYTDNEGQPLLWVMSSAEQTGKIDKTYDVYGLKVRLSELIKTFDYVVIDTSPKIGQLHLMTYLASDWLIYPSEMTYLSIKGLESSFAHYQNIRNEANADGTPKYRIGRVMGILPTKYRSSLKIQKGNLAKLTEQYTEAAFFSPIKFLGAWEEASQLRRPINRLGYDNAAAPEAERFVKQVIDRMEAVEYGEQEAGL